MEDWRIALRQASRGLTTLPVEGPRCAGNARHLLEDALGPAERQVMEEATSSDVTSSSREAAVALTTGSAVAGVSAAFAGGTTFGFATAPLGAAGSWTLKSWYLNEKRASP